MMPVISVCALVLGWLVNEFYALPGLDISQWVTSAEGSATSWWGTVAALVLLLLILRAVWQARKSAACCGESE
jgi:hypothetical protein